MKTRREFLRDCSLIAGTVALAPTAAFAQPLASNANLTGPPGFEQFRRLLNTRFTVRTASDTTSLLLVQVTEFRSLTANLETAANESFSLFFHGPAQLPLPQDTYMFEHPRLGQLSMFIVPVGSVAATHCRYEAVFSRPASAAEFALQLSRAPRRALKC